MTNEEVVAIIGHLNPEHHVLEWGSGGSTVRLSPLVTSYTSIEHNKGWVDKVRPLAPGAKVFYIPNRDNYQTYINAPEMTGDKYDRILIDGRERVACGRAVLDLGLLKPDGLVFIHDWCRDRYQIGLRPHYDVVEEIPSKERDANGLAVLKPRA